MWQGRAPTTTDQALSTDKTRRADRSDGPGTSEGPAGAQEEDPEDGLDGDGMTGNSNLRDHREDPAVWHAARRRGRRRVGYQ